MKATLVLHDLGQSLWLDNITRDLLDNGTLKRYIDDFSITGLTSNPTIFELPFTRAPQVSMASFRWSCRRSWPTTRRNL